MTPAVRVDQISKRFKLYHEKPQTLKERLIFFRRDRTYEEFWALNDVSFQIKQGSTFGLVGANGSGKSTLLKIMAGILRPSSGNIEVTGRVGALLELGAGFHPDLTGRENVYLNASLLGLSRKEIDAKFDEIVGFAELEQFIDNQVRHYSSGMYVRLGFAVAVHVDPDVLLVDEVLSVGDEAFQGKCLERIRSFQQEGRTIVVVTHALDLVRQMCDEAALLINGQLAAMGSPLDVVREHREHMAAIDRAVDEQLDILDTAKISEVRLLDRENSRNDVFPSGGEMTVDVDVEVSDVVDDPVIDINIYDNSGRHIFGTNTHWRPLRVDLLPGEASIKIDIPLIPMREGRFFMLIGIHSRDGRGTIYGRSKRIPFEVKPDSEEPGSIFLPCRFSIEGSAVKTTGVRSR